MSVFPFSATAESSTAYVRVSPSESKNISSRLIVSGFESARTEPKFCDGGALNVCSPLIPLPLGAIMYPTAPSAVATTIAITNSSTPFITERRR